MKNTFSDLGISPKMLTILDRMKFTVPTPIQSKAIPIALTGRDVIGIAQTGTGKTLAFAVPLLQQIANTGKQGLIVLPTRELAMQVEEELRKIGKTIGLRTALIIGGAPIKRQIGAIKNKPHIFVGTPGRINDHLEQKTLRLDNIGGLVLDEADRMLDMGFAPQINKIVKHVPARRQTLLFSATMPREVMRLVNQYMKNPTRVEVATSGTVAERVDQKLYVVKRQQKNQLLEKLLSDHEGTVLVFSRTKHGARKVCQAVNSMGHRSAELHSNLSPGQRRRSMEGFKSGKHRVLVATDIAARGIDVTDIELVINYDLPDNSDDYVHRVGRTGRAGKIGKAISFAVHDQKKQVNGIERSVQQRIDIAALPELPPARPNIGRSDSNSKQSGHGKRRYNQPRHSQPARGNRQRNKSRQQKHRARRIVV